VRTIRTRDGSARPGHLEAPGVACVALIACLCLAPSVARATPPGFAFLEIPAGARASAMGGAYASIATGAEAAFWNPAGLDATRGTEITASHYELYQTLRSEQFAVAGRLFGYGVSASLRALYSEPIEERDEIGNLTGSFGSHDLEFALGIGHKVAEGLTAGGTASIVRERIANLAAGTYAFGAGVAYEPAALPGVRASLSAQNLGPAAHYDIDGARGAPVSLPAGVHGGLSYAIPLRGGYGARAALETRMTQGRSGVAMLGGEVTAGMGAALRLGYRLDGDASTFGVGAGYATGALHFDYAYVPAALDLGDTHRLSFSARF
jgi:hypothetical protein